MIQRTLVIPLVLGALVLGGISFYAGMQYEKIPLSPSSRRQNFDGNRSPRVTGNAPGRNIGGGGFINGEVVSKDATGLTVKLRDGGSKIVFFSSSSTVGKMTEGTMEDITVGTDISINGAANPDGSITASTIQIRPAGSRTREFRSTPSTP